MFIDLLYYLKRVFYFYLLFKKLEIYIIIFFILMLFIYMFLYFCEICILFDVYFTGIIEC